MYKKASRLKLRFTTNRGLLSAEQLWDLSIEDLKHLVKVAYQTVKSQETKEDELSFLEEGDVVKEDAKLVADKLRFEILKDVWNTRKNEREDAAKKAAKKKERQRLIDLIAEKEAEAEKSLSVDELKKKLAAMNEE